MAREYGHIHFDPEIETNNSVASAGPSPRTSVVVTEVNSNVEDGQRRDSTESTQVKRKSRLTTSASIHGYRHLVPRKHLADAEGPERHIPQDISVMEFDDKLDIRYVSGCSF